MSVPPFGTPRLIPPGPNDPRINARVGILHVDAGNAETLYYLFLNNQRGSGIESHCHVKRNGVCEVYRNADYEADANNLANPFAYSVETQGYGEGEWTAEQLSTIKRIMLWARDELGIPLRVVQSWNDSRGGWGYHTIWGSPSAWTPVAKSCPGPDRIRQFWNVLVPWMKEQEIDVLSPEDKKLLEDTLAEIRAARGDFKEWKEKELKRDRKQDELIKEKFGIESPPR